VERRRWPTPARFWLEWECPYLPDAVIPTGTDRRKVMICGVERSYLMLALDSTTISKLGGLASLCIDTTEAAPPDAVFVGWAPRIST
jgi:hypothetical protein